MAFFLKLWSCLIQSRCCTCLLCSEYPGESGGGGGGAGNWVRRSWAGAELWRTIPELFLWGGNSRGPGGPSPG